MAWGVVMGEAAMMREGQDGLGEILAQCTGPDAPNPGHAVAISKRRV